VDEGRSVSGGIHYMKIYFWTVIVILISVTNIFSQSLDTLRYYYPFKYDSANTMLFIGECFSEGYCEPIGVWFTPDSIDRDSSLKYFSIKKIRLCFMNSFDVKRFFFRYIFR
jgi:hypothetical protein